MPYNAKLTAVHVFTTNTPAGFDRNIYNDVAFWERWYLWNSITDLR
jgi:hypothetical protein